MFLRGAECRGINPGGWGSATPSDFGQGCRGQVVKYYYIISCRPTGSMFESCDLKRNRIICPYRSSCELPILPGKSKFFVKLPEKIEIFGKCAWKNRFFCKTA